MWRNSKTRIVTKLKNSNCKQTQKLKFWQNSKTQIVTKLKNSNCDKTQKLKLWQNTTTPIALKIQKSISERKIYYFCNNNSTPQQLIKCSLGSHLRYCNVKKQTFIIIWQKWLNLLRARANIKPLTKVVASCMNMLDLFCL